MPSVSLARKATGGLLNQFTISRGVSQDPRNRFWFEAWNSQMKFNSDATFIGYNNGCKIIRGVLILNYVSKSEADQVNAFFADTIRFIRPFSIILSSAGGADLGRGAGVTLDVCYLDVTDTSTSGIVTPLGKGNKYNVEIPYICLDNVTAEGSFP